MKIIIFSTFDNGGAGKFSYNLHKSFMKNGLTSSLIVKEKTIKDQDIIQISKSFFANMFYDFLEYLAERYFPETQTDPKYYFYNKIESFTKYPVRYIIKHLPYNPDIILICWTSGFVNFETIYKLQLATKAKVVFYFTDMGNLTGGCHYDMFCNKYITDCTNCPAILNRLSGSRANKNLLIKKRYIQKIKPYIFPGTNTLRMQAQQSFLYKDLSLFECTNAPINPNIFNQKLAHIAKEIIEIKSEKRVIFIGSSYINEYRKGFEYLLEALVIFKQKHPSIVKNILLLIAGNILPQDTIETLSGYEIKYLEYIQDDKMLSIVYQACDMFVCPTIYDSGPLMVMESLMCGTPVVSFDVGVSSDLVINNYTGYKARNYISEDLSNGIFSILNLTESEYIKMRNNCVLHSTSLCSEEILIQKIITNLKSISE